VSAVIRSIKISLFLPVDNYKTIFYILTTLITLVLQADYFLNEEGVQAELQRCTLIEHQLPLER